MSKIIAINARFILPNYMEGYGNYIVQLYSRVAVHMPHVTFYFITDRAVTQHITLPNNCHFKLLPPAARHPILWHYWYNVAIPKLLKQLQANLYISPDGFGSLTTKVPQIIVIHDLAFLHLPKAIRASHLWYYKRYTPKCIHKSDQVITVSQHSKNEIIQAYNVPPAKITIVHNAASEHYKPLLWQQHQAVKDEYTQGKEYFVCVSSIHPRKNIINLLKAFSIFKKWQVSNMKLVLIGRLAWNNTAFEQLYNTYKYKADVILLGYQPTTTVALIVAAAYCAIYPSLYEGFGVPILEAMQCGVPVITSNTTGMLEAGGGAALYADPTSATDIAAQLQLIYKDEQLRANKVIAGLEHARLFNWDSSAKVMCTVINNVMHTQVT